MTGRSSHLHLLLSSGAGCMHIVLMKPGTVHITLLRMLQCGLVSTEVNVVKLKNGGRLETLDKDMRVV